jgi:hypothetical protein
MAKNDNEVIVPDELLVSKIYYIRGSKVMLDEDLAALYGVETKQLKRQVRRNIDRFPEEDFMFELTKDELSNSRHQIGTSSWGGTRYTPMAFTSILHRSPGLASASEEKTNKTNPHPP